MPLTNGTDARNFLSRVVAWPPMGSPDAYVNIHWTHQKPGYNNPAFRGSPCRSVEECITAITRNIDRPGNKDFYVCLSTQREMHMQQHGTGSFPVAVRNIDNAVEFRSLWIDVDVEEGNKNGKAYKSTKEAGEALIAFLKHTHLPKPTIIVKSGSGGFHVYWTLTSILTYDQWRPLALALVEAARRHGFRIDGGCTVDGARVLRIPGTLNRKHTPPRAVELASCEPNDIDVDVVRKALAPYGGAQVIPLNTSRGNANDELSSGIEAPKAPPVAIETIAQAGCSFIKEALDTGGARYPNPLWNLTTLVATFTEGGRVDAHRMASGHATYTQADTDALFDRKEAEKLSRGIGWPSCDAVENAGCSHCATCPIRQPQSKPLQFGRPTKVHVPPPPQGAVVDTLPEGYHYDSSRRVMRRALAKDGTPKEVMICPYPIYNGSVQRDPYVLNFSTILDHFNTESQISLRAEHINRPDACTEKLATQGMFVTQSKEMKEFLMSWSKKLQDTKGKILVSAPFGWVHDNGKREGFAYAGDLYLRVGKRTAQVPEGALIRQYTPRGDLAKWKNAAQMLVDLRSPQHLAYIAAAFAGPLVHFTGQEGLLLSSYSPESARFKSTSLKVAQAVWGHPVLAMNSLTDTNVSVTGKMRALKHLPLFWDELKTQHDTERFVALTFQLAGGKEKGRSNTDASLKEVGMWETLIMSASNESLLDSVAKETKTTSAGIYRVFEFTVDRPPTVLTAAQADQIVNSLKENYGLAGKVYAEYLGQHQDRIESEIVKIKEALERQLSANNEERYWISSVACLFLGLMYATHAGLVNVTNAELTSFYQWLKNAFQAMRVAKDESGTDMRQSYNISSVVQGFINDNRRKVLVTDKMWRVKGRPTSNFCKVEHGSDTSQGIVVHIAVVDKFVRISRKAFTIWCEQHKYPSSSITNAVRSQFNAKDVQGKLGSGAGVYGAMGAEWMLEIDISSPSMSELINLD